MKRDIFLMREAGAVNDLRNRFIPADGWSPIVNLGHPEPNGIPVVDRYSTCEISASGMHYETYGGNGRCIFCSYKLSRT